MCISLINKHKKEKIRDGASENDSETVRHNTPTSHKNHTYCFKAFCVLGFLI